MKVAHEADPPVDDEIWVHLVKSGSLVLIEDKIPFEPWSNLSNFRATIIKHFELNRAPHNVNPLKLVLKPAADGAPLRDMSMKLFAVQFHRDHNGLHIYVEVPPAQKNEKGGRVDFGGLRDPLEDLLCRELTSWEVPRLTRQFVLDPACRESLGYVIQAADPQLAEVFIERMNAVLLSFSRKALSQQSPYVIDRPLDGAGAQGTLSRGINTVTGETVCLKIFSPNASEQADKEFRHLVKVSASLESPAMFRPIEMITLPHHQKCLVTPLLGISLAHVTQAVRKSKKGMSGGVVKSIAVSALAGLHAAHSSGILHNDVCPHNICLNDLAPGVAVLIDFGSSTVVGSYESVKTRDEYGLGRRPGSHTYDLVCLAATVYELCTTAHPSWPACEAWANSEVSPEEDPWPRRFVRHCLFSSSTAGVATALKREFPLDESLFARLWPQARGDSQQIEKDASSHPSSSSSCSTEGKQTAQEDQEATETVFLVSTEDSHQEEAQTRRKPEVASEEKQTLPSTKAD